MVCGLHASTAEWERAVHGVDGVFHLAWSTVPSTAQSAPLDDIETNLVGTVRLLEALRGKSVPIVFASSGGTVYGAPTITPIPENHAIRPIGVYGATKASAERYFIAYRQQYNVDARIARLSNPYGAHWDSSRGQGAITVFARRALNRQPIEIWGTGQTVRDYVYIADAVEALLAMMQADSDLLDDADPVINIGSGIGTTLLEIVDSIQSVLERPVEVRLHASRSFDVPLNILDISLAQKLLHWTPSTTLDRGIQRTVVEMETAFKNQ